MENKKVLLGVILAVLVVGAGVAIWGSKKHQPSGGEGGGVSLVPKPAVVISAEQIKNTFPADLPIEDKAGLIYASTTPTRFGINFNYDYSTKYSVDKLIQTYADYFKSKGIKYVKAVDLPEVKALGVNTPNAQFLVNASLNDKKKYVIVNLSLMLRTIKEFPQDYPFEAGAEVKNVDIPKGDGVVSFEKDFVSKKTVAENGKVFSDYLAQNLWRIEPSAEKKDAGAVYIKARQGSATLDIYIRKDPQTSNVIVQSVLIVSEK